MGNHQAGPVDDRLRSMIADQMLEAVIFVDPEGTIRWWNRGAEVLFGFTAAEAVGESLDLIVPEKLRRAHDQGFRRAVASGHLHKTQGQVLTTRSLNKYGARLYVDFAFGILKDEDGTLLGVYAVGRDATARHMQEVAAQVQHQQAQAAAAAQQR